jgi:hypothetical protein
MALVAISAKASPEVGSIQRSPQVIGEAGENILLGAPCYMHTDGKIFMADGTAANAKTKVVGFAVRQANSGEPVTLHGVGSVFYYADAAQTPAAILYLGTTAGRLDTATTTGDSVGVAQVLADGRSIRVTRAI